MILVNPPVTFMSIGELVENRFKQLRAHLVLTQDHFAKKIGRTKAYISNVENGHSGMSRSTISSICSVFGVNAEWLLTGTGEMFLPEQEVEPVSREEIGRRIRDIRKRVSISRTD